MKKLISFALSLTLLLSLAVTSVFAAQKTKEDYLTVYNDYKTFYENDYVTAYTLYNKSLSGLAEGILAADIKTQAQADRILTFLNHIKETKTSFFGTRDTVNKSRYIVPELRGKMTDAAAKENYAEAVNFCGKLKDAVAERIGVLNDLSSEISSFDVIEAAPAASAKFSVNTGYSKYFYEFTIIITNDSDTPITDWTLLFDYDGTINTVWVNGSGMTLSKKGKTFSISANNQYQSAYTIPANSSLTIQGNGNSVGTAVSNATLSGQSISMSFIKN